MVVVAFKKALTFKDDFWPRYPRKVAKKAAERAWNNAVKKIDPAIIVSGLDAFLNNLPENTKFIPHAATWINGERWEDDYTPPLSGEQMAHDALAEKYRREDEAARLAITGGNGKAREC